MKQGEKEMKRRSPIFGLWGCALLVIALLAFGGNALVSAPERTEDPSKVTPTAPSMNIKIDDFKKDLSTTETSYSYTMEATGTGCDEAVQGFYTIWAYSGASGHAQQSWKEGPIDENRSYGSHAYREQFFGTGPEGSWSTWKWIFHSTGPIDDSNRQEFEDPGSYWAGLDRMVLYVRIYNDEENWNQASKDITEEYTGIEKGGNIIDDKIPTDDGKDDGKQTPGFDMVLVSLSFLVLIIFYGKVKDLRRTL